MVNCAQLKTYIYFPRLIPLLFLSAVFGGDALAADKTAVERDPVVNFERYNLPNGLQVILHQDRTVPLVAVNVWFHVGSGDEVPGKSGFAHLFEHMMFQGTKHTGEDAHFKILRQIGASNINGTTNSDRTNYFEVVPSHQIETALWLESERLGYMLPMLTEQSLANQRAVVRNERRQSYDNQPYGKEWFAICEALYAEGHPYRYDTIGRHEDVENASLSDVRAFYQTWYVPANATLAIAGDFAIDDVKKLVTHWFGSFPRSTRPGHRMVDPTPIEQSIRQTVKDPLAQLPRLHYAWHSPKFFAAGDAELDIVATTLGREGSGRLYKELVLKKQVAQDVSVYQASAELSSVFHVVVDLKPTASLAAVEQLVNDELERMRTTLISAEEFHRAIVEYETNSIWALEGLMYRSDMLQRYNHYVGNPDYLTADLDRYRKTSPEKIREIFQQYIDPTHRVTIITEPAAGLAPPATTALLARGGAQ